MVKYEVFIEQPTLDFYRLSYSPKEGCILAGLWIGGMFTGASGKRYHGMRGFNEFSQNMAHSYGFFMLNEQNLADFSPELYPELTPIDQMERYEYSESADAVHFVGENLRLDARVGSFDWSDANGRWELHSEQLGQAFTFWVPEQEVIPMPMQYRSQIGKATGKINGDPVEGYTYLDAIYSHSGFAYLRLPLIRKIEKQWSSWLVEYIDGDIDAGLAWKGFADTGFSAAHLIRSGVSTALSDSRVFTTYDQRGTVRKIRVELGSEVVELEQDTCSDWPSHTFGRVVSTSRGKEIAKSWTFTEWVPDNVEELTERYLAGEIQARDSQKARIENERLVFPEHMP